MAFSSSSRLRRSGAIWSEQGTPSPKKHSIIPKLSRAELADLMLRQLSDRAHLGKTPGVAVLAA